MHDPLFHGLSCPFPSIVFWRRSIPALSQWLNGSVDGCGGRSGFSLNTWPGGGGERVRSIPFSDLERVAIKRQ